MKMLLNMLGQMIQNATARVNETLFTHVISMPGHCMGFWIGFWIQLKVWMLIYKTLYGLTPMLEKISALFGR